MPIFSIVVPVYNAEKYLDECLESIRIQSFDDFEVILVDDGSTDGSLSIMRRYSDLDSRFKVVSQENRGVSSARNQGIALSAGKYISFVDADDFVESSYLKTICASFESHDADIVVFGGRSTPSDENVDLLMSTSKVVYVGNSIEALFNETGSRPYMCNKAYRLDLLKKTGAVFDECLSIGEDQAFQFKVFPKARTVSFIQDVLYFYRQNSSGSASSRLFGDRDLRASQHCRMVDAIGEWWVDAGVMPENRARWINWCIPFVHRWIKDADYKTGSILSQSVVSRIAIEDIELMRPATRLKWRDLCELSSSRLGQPKVSVIIPMYNSARYVSQCLQSLVRQTLYSFEVICVDDGSTDETVSVVEDFIEKDDRIRLLRQEHGFAGKARNLAMKVARGQYLLFLDSDDYFESTLLEEAYSRASGFDADICVFRAFSHDQATGEDGLMPWTCNTRLAPRDEVFSAETMPDNIFCFTTAAPWTKLFRRSFIEDREIVFQQTRSANDLLFVFLALSLAPRVVVLDRYLVHYRINEASSLQATQDRCPLAFYDALVALKESLVDHGVYQLVERGFVNFALDYCIYNLSTLKTKTAFSDVYYYLREVVFPFFGITDRGPESFYAYTNRIYERKEDIKALSPEEYAKKYSEKAFLRNES